MTLHLLEALRDTRDRAARLTLRARCDPAGGPFQADLPLFRSHCPKSRILPLPAWDAVTHGPSRRGARAPEIWLKRGSHRVLTLAVVPADPVAALRPLPEGPSRVEVHVDADTHGRLIGWDPRQEPEIPCSRATPDLTWRCPDHAPARGQAG